MVNCQEPIKKNFNSTITEGIFKAKWPLRKTAATANYPEKGGPSLAPNTARECAY